MYCDPFATSYITDNLFTADRIAALCPIDEQIVETFHLEFRVCSQSENTFNNRCDSRLFFRCGFLQPIRNNTGNNLLGRDLTVADR